MNAHINTMVISEAVIGTSFPLLREYWMANVVFLIQGYANKPDHVFPVTSRVRRSILREAAREVSYASQVNRKIKVKGGTADYLQVTETNNLIVGPQSERTSAACFRVHTFEVLRPYPEGGQVVVLETHDGGRFLHGSASGSLSLMEGTRVEMEQAMQTDDRFFLVYSDVGDRYTKIKHLHTGLFLSASYTEVSLLSHTSGFSDQMLFESFHCSHS
ncbi:uncharacterized protein [Cherax quadricarinatus]|uniref:uncharacterized protein isoform X1 n=1 Tax=Cherax quadricarinatus TaxID=27406 RepID=UPI00387E2A2E